VLGELVTDFLREIDLKSLVKVGQSCEQLVDVRADFVGKLLNLSRFAEPVRFPSLEEDSFELHLCLDSCFRASMLAFLFPDCFCCQCLLAFLFGQSLASEPFGLRLLPGQSRLPFPLCLGTMLCGFLFSLEAFLILGIEFGQVLEDFVGLLDLESVVSGKVQEDQAAIAENEQGNTRGEAGDAVWY